MTTTTIEAVREYLAHGWKLCAVKPQSKIAYQEGWGKLDLDEGHWKSKPDDGVGLLLGRSRVVSIDIDDLDASICALSVIGIDLEELLGAPDAVRIISRPGRAKLLYRIPDDGMEHVSRKYVLHWRRDGSTYTVIEFRAGSFQDVLPPSIHPSTGRPYEWGGDWRAMPELPESLARVWADWPTVHQAMIEADPMHEEMTEIERRPRAEYHVPHVEGERSGLDVINLWNDTFCASDMMERPALRARYEPAGARYRRVGSKEKPGMVLLRCNLRAGMLVGYSHHGGDEVFRGRLLDAFGIFCDGEHRGDSREAVRAAAQELGLPPLPKRDTVPSATSAQVEAIVQRMRDKVEGLGGGVQVDDVFEAEFEEVGDDGDDGDGDAGGKKLLPAVTAEKPPPAGALVEFGPSFLAARPLPIGIGQELAYYVAGRVDRPKASTTIQTVLSLLSHLAGRRYEGDDGTRPGLLAFCLDSASVTLAPYMSAQLSILEALGELPDGVVKASHIDERNIEITTTQQLRIHYETTPRCLWVGTSVTSLLEREQRQLNPTFRLLLDHIGMIAHGEVLRIKTGRETRTVYHPSIAAIWALTPLSVGSLIRTSTRSGLIKQALVVDAQGEDAGTSPRRELSAALVDQLRVLSVGPGPAPGAVSAPDTEQRYRPQIVPGLAARDAVFEGLRAELRAMAGATDHLRQHPLGGCSVGWSRAARSIALALAAADHPLAPCVTDEHVEWSCRWVRDCWGLFLSRARHTSEDSADMERQVIEALRKAGRKGATASEVRDAVPGFRRLGKDGRDSLLAGMAEDGAIVCQPARGGVRWFIAAPKG
jgi:hypothetical protein